LKSGGPGGRARARDSLDEQPRQSRRSVSSHGRYTVVRKLAEGGMAEIFLGQQRGSEGFEKPVVLKRIHTAFLADAQFRNMLIDEAHISMSLHHNNIVQVLDLGRAGGRMFLVLELVDGWDMARILERAAAAHFPLPTGLGLYLLAEVCRALSYAHGRTRADGLPMGIVHRDVSPQNVLLSEQGEVKLTDFGIAKALTKRDRTATGVVKGKVAFMSPEQASGQSIDARSDLFSFGTMLYLVATGVRPFEAASDFEVIARVQKGVFRAPEEVRPDMSPALAAVIRRSMGVDREQRYQTADELLVDLEGIWRSDFGAPGQTELKLWLAELGRRDGVLPIARARASFPTTGDTTAGMGAGDLAEGQALILGDEGSADTANRQMARLGRDDDAESDMNDVSGMGMSDLAQLGRLDTLSAAAAHGAVTQPTMSRPGARQGHGGRPRVTDSQGVISGMEATSVHDLTLSIGDDSGDRFAAVGADERGIRDGRDLRPAREGRGIKLGFVLFLAITVGGVALAWRLAGSRQAAPGATTEPVQPAVPSRPGPANDQRPRRPAPVATKPEASRPTGSPPAPPAAAAPAPTRPGRERPGAGHPAPAPSNSAWSPLRRPPILPPPVTEPEGEGGIVVIPPSAKADPKPELKTDPPPPTSPAEILGRDPAPAPTPETPAPAPAPSAESPPPAEPNPRAPEGNARPESEPKRDPAPAPPAHDEAPLPPTPQ
jgi:tRNA A-37 threonylcarbamoyl transferase component Bud32